MSSYLIYKDILFFLILKNFSKIIFLIIIVGTLISISTNSWISSWLGLEINLISFISLIIFRKKLISTEASLIYFIVQAIASTIFLYAIIMYIFNSSLTFIFIENFHYLIILALIIKLGAAPIHFWLPLIIININWINNYLIITWQKLAPIILLSYCRKINRYLFIIFIIISSIIGSVGGFNQINLKKAIAYSSINYIRWLLVSLTININLWKIFFLCIFIYH